jgi:hypothetical protein
MLAGMVIVSAKVGVIATAAAFVMSAPAWVALAIYPVVCSLTLLITAAVWNIRTSQPARNARVLHPQA